MTSLSDFPQTSWRILIYRYISIYALIKTTVAAGIQDAVEHVTVSVGQPAVLHCDLEFPGGVVEPYTVHWLKQGIRTPIYIWQDGQPPLIADSYRGRLALAGQASLNITQVRDTDQGWFECRVFIQSHLGDSISTNGTWVHLEVQDEGLHFTEEPSPAVILLGGVAELRCSTSPPAELRWKLNGRFLQPGADEDIQVEPNRLILRARSDRPRQRPLDGYYQCVAVIGQRALSSQPARVTVAVLNPFKDLNDITIESPEGSVAVIPCPPPLSIPPGILKLKRNGTIIQQSDRIHLLQSGYFKFQTVRKSDEGPYHCSIENPIIHQTQISPYSIHLIVTAPVEPRPPQLLVSPQQSYAVTLNSNLTLECVASGLPRPNITWTKYGGQLPRGRHSQSMDNLYLFNLQRGDEGTFVCQADNGFGPTASAYSIVDIQERPEITKPPQNQTAIEGSEVILDCASKGLPKPLLTWVHNGNTIDSDEMTAIKDTRLVLRRVTVDSSGYYQCFATNELGTIYATARLSVLPREDGVPIGGRGLDGNVGGNAVMSSAVAVWSSRPTITLPPSNLTSPPGQTVVLPCLLDPSAGAVQSWLRSHRAIIFGQEPRFERAPSGALRISRVEYSDSGLYTCLAISAHGYSTASAYLTVIDSSNKSSEEVGGDSSIQDNASSLANKSQEGSEINSSGISPTAEDFNGYARGRKKKPKPHKKKTPVTASDGKALMIPPTKPDVTKLSDESVMVRWDVPPNDGLDITFFKVQYKDVSKTDSRWMTIDDDIAKHIRSYEVPNLKTGHTYRFRIAAVYTNNDNMQGPNSAKFLLQKDPPMKKPIVGPMIVHAESVSPSAIMIRWQYLDTDTVPIEGFFIYYRATTNAGDYTKVTVLGPNTKSHIISHLLPDTAYDIKMQCFNIAGTSEFSNIVTEKTFASILPVDRTTGVDETVPVSTTQASSELLYMILGIVLGVMVLILVIFMVMCGYKQRQQRRQLLAAIDQTIRSKYQDPGAEFKMNTPLASLNGMIPINGHTRITNGHVPQDKINISVNPMAHYDGQGIPQVPQVMETSLSEIPTGINNNNTLERNRRLHSQQERPVGEEQCMERSSLLRHKDDDEEDEERIEEEDESIGRCRSKREEHGEHTAEQRAVTTSLLHGHGSEDVVDEDSSLEV